MSAAGDSIASSAAPASAAAAAASGIATAASGVRCPLHLPDSYLGRQVRVGDVHRVCAVSGTGAGIASTAAAAVAFAAAAAASGIATATFGVRCPLHLPDSRLGRQVRVGDVHRV